jgi:hypothetical protein
MRIKQGKNAENMGKSEEKVGKNMEEILVKKIKKG